MAKNEKTNQKATSRAVNTKGGMQTTNKSSNCNKTTSQTTDSGDGCGCGCGTKSGDGERKK
ncbi:hypothetical protein [uncultured Gemmiger sp.]|uniref:hypothetical protein n=1 Tax=uncultured Gemmiger sp. TaxID=1623490 RepID=UPI0025FBD250|nr:hypothetical protein [uncultured Gemmiger sp.]